MLNSRPLVPLSSDLDDLNVLTPSPFLIGRSITSIVEPDLTNLNENRLVNWQKITKIFHLIWKRWSVDYLNSLQQRNKWHFEKRDAKIGDMVIIKEDNLPSCQWSLGRINNIYPGKDSKVRVVEVKTTRGREWEIIVGIEKQKHNENSDTNVYKPAGWRSWFVAVLVRLMLRIRSRSKSVDFHDEEKRQRPCRTIMRHVKDPLSACLTSALGKIKNLGTVSHHQSSGASPVKETGCQITCGDWYPPISYHTKKRYQLPESAMVKHQIAAPLEI
ncbi:DUF5641 domain-containing protein [Trichonephila clavipes]|nr:DUF5641 domain-containing protein [Trichonephila clavipes]